MGAIFTKSSSASCALFIASLADIIPNCSPFSPIRRISLSLICSLIINSLIVVHLHQHFQSLHPKKWIVRLSTLNIYTENSRPKALCSILTDSRLLRCGESGYSSLFSNLCYFTTITFFCQRFLQVLPAFP